VLFFFDFLLPKVPTFTTSWLKNVRDDFYIPPNAFHLLRGFFSKHIIIPKQSSPTWSFYRISISELPTLKNSKSSLPFSSCTVLFDSKLTLLYVGVLNSWSNSLQLWGHDTTQIHNKMTMDANLEGSAQQAKQDAINRRNGQGPKHLKFFLLVFLTLRPKPNTLFHHPSGLRKITKSKGTGISI